MNDVTVGGTNQSFWMQAYRNLQLACKRVARRHNLNRKPHRYRVGDIVWYRLKLSSSKAQKISAKLQLRWSEPVVIVKTVRPNVVLLGNPKTGVIIRRAHITQLEPCAK